MLNEYYQALLLANVALQKNTFMQAGLTTANHKLLQHAHKPTNVAAIVSLVDNTYPPTPVPVIILALN